MANEKIVTGTTDRKFVPDAANSIPYKATTSLVLNFAGL